MNKNNLKIDVDEDLLAYVKKYQIPMRLCKKNKDGTRIIIIPKGVLCGFATKCKKCKLDS